MSFAHVAWRSLPYSMGVEIGSDFHDEDHKDDESLDLYRSCGFWSKAEKELLLLITEQYEGLWLEIGAHTGWCAEAIVRDQLNTAIAIEPMFSYLPFYLRFTDNVREELAGGLIMPWAGRSDQFFQVWNGPKFDGCLIDGDHEAPHPLNDAIGCYERLDERGVILLHDFRGGSIWDAGKYLADQGMKWRVYPSVHMVFVAWRGEFDPPPDIKEGDVDWVKHYGLPEWAR